MDQVASPTPTALRFRGWISVRSRHVFKGHTHLDQWFSAADGLLTFRMARTAAVRSFEWHTEHGEVAPKCAASSKALGGVNAIGLGLSGDGGLQRHHVSRRSSRSTDIGIRHAAAADRGSEESRVRCDHRVCRRGKVGEILTVPPVRRIGIEHDPFRLEIATLQIPHCHNSVTGAVACAAYCRRHRSDRCNSGYGMVASNLTVRPANITWTVSNASQQTPVGTALAWLCQVHLKVAAVPKPNSGRLRQHAINVT